MKGRGVKESSKTRPYIYLLLTQPEKSDPKKGFILSGRFGGYVDGVLKALGMAEQTWLEPITSVFKAQYKLADIDCGRVEEAIVYTACDYVILAGKLAIQSLVAKPQALEKMRLRLTDVVELCGRDRVLVYTYNPAILGKPDGGLGYREAILDDIGTGCRTAMPKKPDTVPPPGGNICDLEWSPDRDIVERGVLFPGGEGWDYERL